jgi:hypothetical protein
MERWVKTREGKGANQFYVKQAEWEPATLAGDMHNFGDWRHFNKGGIGDRHFFRRGLAPF